MANLLDAAVNFGVPVFACGSDKAPLVKGGFKSATTDRAELERQFSNPRAVMIGMPMGSASGIWALDIDTKADRSGIPWLEASEPALPPTRRHRTRSGGLHLIWRWDDIHPIRNSAGRIAAGVDVRGEGGFIIVPPSPGYTCISDAPVSFAPNWLLAAAGKPRPAVEPERLVRGTGPLHERVRGRLARAYAAVAHAGEGSRNDTLNREAFILAMLAREGMLDRETIYAEMCHAAYKAGLPQPEVRATLHSAFSAAGV